MIERLLEERAAVFKRWLKFNLVGAIGVAAQLAALGLFSRVLGLRDLVATALAVETSLLHNFIWHEQFTWASRVGGASLASALRRLLRFHLSNGLISVGGNTAVVWLLTRARPVPLLWANLIAIAACGLLNFVASDRLVFRGEPRDLEAAAEIPDFKSEDEVAERYQTHSAVLIQDQLETLPARVGGKLRARLTARPSNANQTPASHALGPVELNHRPDGPMI